MARFRIKHLVSGGIITNYFCTSKCRHCLYNCGPHWEKKYMDPATAEDHLRMVRFMGCRSVHIGGGEPLLRPDSLTEILEVAENVGVSIEYVETNSSWFNDMESAAHVLSRLRKKGLKTLLVSISPFHNEHIPFVKVQGVMEACRKARIHVFPWINGFIKDLSQLDVHKTNSMAVFEEKFGEDYLFRILQRYWIHMGGRALDTFRPVLAKQSFQEIINENPEGCKRELSDTSHFHMDLFGNYIPGLCSGLSISTKDLGQPLSEKTYPVITTLFNSGIKGLFELAHQDFKYTPARSKYVNKCDLCMEIRTVMATKTSGGLSELRPREFYSI
jgi:radical SAM family protein